MNRDPQIFSDAAVIEDHEQVARRANVRLWWRRAITLTLVVLIGAPIGGAIVWWIRFGHLQQIEFNPPGENGEYIRRAYTAYMRAEGHNNRAALFEQCALNVRPFAGQMSEAEVLYYLGPPTSSTSSVSRTDHLYDYREFRPGDSHVVVSIVPTSDGKRTVGKVHIQAGIAAPRPAEATTAPSIDR